MNRGRASDRALVGVISDTHGRVPGVALHALTGCDAIVHAGDLVDPDVVRELGLIAPVTAVRGNMDRDPPGCDLPRTAVLTAGGASLYVLHDLYQLDLDPAAAGLAAVIHGHTHRPDIDWRGEVLFLNPGSASRPRNGTPTVARIAIADGRLDPQILYLDD